MIDILELNTFLKMFSGNNTEKQTLSQFINNAVVRVGKNIRPLKEYMLSI